MRRCAVEPACVSRSLRSSGDGDQFREVDPLTARSRAGDRLRTPTIVLTGAVVDVDGTNVTLDDIAISNNEFGCFAG